MLRQPPRQLTRLGMANRIQRNIQMPLQAAGGIPVGFAMAHQAQAGGGKVSSHGRDDSKLWGWVMR